MQISNNRNQKLNIIYIYIIMVSINDLPQDLLVVITALEPLRLTSLVCKYWRRLLLLNRIELINAELVNMKMESILKLPASFYSNLTLVQKILLPNVLFERMSIATQYYGYSRYKYKIPWPEGEYNVTYERYLNNAGHNFRSSRKFHFIFMFEKYIQFRYHVYNVLGVNHSELRDIAFKVMGMDIDLTTKPRILYKFASFLLNHYIDPDQFVL